MRGNRSLATELTLKGYQVRISEALRAGENAEVRGGDRLGFYYDILALLLRAALWTSNM